MRDDRGRWVKGSTGNPNGRPKRPDFLTCVKRAAEANSETLDDWIMNVGKAIYDAALAGDVSAAKLILDRALGPLEKQEVNVNVGVGVQGPQPPQGKALSDYVVELGSVLEDARKGKPLGQNSENPIEEPEKSGDVPLLPAPKDESST